MKFGLAALEDHEAKFSIAIAYFVKFGLNRLRNHLGTFSVK